MGTHATIKTFKEIRPDLTVIDLDDEFKEGDLCWIETPLNPTGESR
jgi:cystathionine gamma-synthase